MYERIPPELLVPGTPVLCYTDSGYSGPSVRSTTIKKVASRTFSVNDEREPRFPIDGRGVAQGNGFSFRRVVLFDSDTARQQLAEARKHQLHNTARDAADTWVRKSTQTNRLALIAALQAVEKDMDE